MTIKSARLLCGTFASSLFCGAAGAPLAPTPLDDIQHAINGRLGLLASDIVEFSVPDTPGVAMDVPIRVGNQDYTLSLVPFSVRAPGYQLLLQVAGGALVSADPGPIRTMRGVVLELPGSKVSGALLKDGLQVSIELASGDQYWIEPIVAHLPAARRDLYVVYNVDDMLPEDASCGVDDTAARDRARRRLGRGDGGGGGGGAASGGTVFCADLACDADFEYFFDHNEDVDDTQAAIETIVNDLNAAPYDDVQILHRISAIIIRTSPADPYTNTTNPQTLLNEFQAHWNANHDNITRAVAELFTGRGLDGDIVGIANINQMCNPGAAYCLTENRPFSAAFKADLSAHELGHVWGADHCDCDRDCPNGCQNPQCSLVNDGCQPFTMNPCITSIRNFHPGCTIPDILATRDLVGCLDSCSMLDCNNNGLPDDVDIANGLSEDCNLNAMPDECEPDCNGNGIPEDCDLVSGLVEDCNDNFIADSCDIQSGVSRDCNSNGVPDECDVTTGPDCNMNGIPDDCDISPIFQTASGDIGWFGAGRPGMFTISSPPAATGIGTWIVTTRYDSFFATISVRLNGTLITTLGGATCPAINTEMFSVSTATFNNAMTGHTDALIEMIATFAADPYVCDPVAFISVSIEYPVEAISQDLNVNGIPDECEPDCNGNGVPDDLDLSSGGSQDDNNNTIPDECDINNGSSSDCDGNGVLDELEFIDCNSNGVPDQCDINDFGTASGPLSPIDNNFPKSFTISSAPSAVGDVTLWFTARADLSSSGDHIDIKINGDLIGTVFDGMANNCPAVSNDQLVVDMNTYNQAVGGGDAVIDMVPSFTVSACNNPTSFIRVTVAYPVNPTSSDCDENDVPDDCEFIDCNGNMVTDQCDISNGTSQDINGNGIPDECDCPADVNSDGAINVLDLVAVLLCFGQPAIPDCVGEDVNEDGAVNVLDLTQVQLHFGETCP